MMDRKLFTVSVILCSMVFLARGSPAAIFNVNTPAAFQTALTTAQGNGQDDTINVAAGLYDVSGGGLTYSGAAEAFSLTIEGAGAATTILDGGGVVQILAITANNITPSVTVTIRGMTFQNGAFNSAPPGTLSVLATNISLESCNFINNNGATPPFPGGGGANLNAFGTITVTGCEFSGNTGDVGAGGLNIQNQEGTTFVSKNLIVQNTGGTSGAGGAWIRDTGFVGGSITLVNNIIDDNHFSAGVFSGLNAGGLAIATSAISGATTVTLTNNTVVSNSANLSAQDGGTVVFGSSTTTTFDLYNNIFFGNLAGSPGPTPTSSDLSAGFAGAPLNLFNNILGTFSVAGNVSQGNNLSSDPLLDATAHLQAFSPAIDNGANAAPSVPSDDIDGDARPLDGDGNSVAVVDIGADEAPGVVIPVPDIAVTPSSITFPDVIQAQSSPPEEVTISNTGTADLSVSEIAPVTGTHYSVAVGGSNACPNLTPTIAASDNCTVQVTFSPQTVASNIADTLRITSNDPDEGTIDVSLSGNGVAGPTPNIAVAPTSITFTDIVVGNSSTPDNVTISNTGTAALNVSGISLDDTTNFSLDLSGGPNGCGIATPSIAIGDNCTVSVTFTPQSEASFGATLTVASNDPDTPNATVSLSGNGTPAPAPNISVPATVDLGEVVVNDNSVPNEVAISNTGNLVLNVSSIALDAGTDVSLNLGGGSNPCGGATPSIAMGDNCTVSLVFSPLSVGAISDNLAITSDDPDEGVVTVPLSGTGLDNVTPAITSATGSGSIMLDTSGNAGTFFSDVQALLDTDPSLNQTGKPPEQFPHGITAFKINNVTPGGTVMMDITLPAAIPGGSTYHVVGTGGFAPFDNVAISGNTATLTLVDGGSGDIDGTADGMITHTGGLATPAPSPSSGGDNGCSCRIAGKGGINADSVGTAAVLVIPFLWLALVRRLNKRKR